MFLLVLNKLYFILIIPVSLTHLLVLSPNLLHYDPEEPQPCSRSLSGTRGPWGPGVHEDPGGLFIARENETETFETPAGRWILLIHQMHSAGSGNSVHTHKLTHQFMCSSAFIDLEYGSSSCLPVDSWCGHFTLYTLLFLKSRNVNDAPCCACVLIEC